MTPNKLQGQVAIITGGGRGIGKAAAEELAAMGASVIITARSAAQIESVAAEIRATGAEAAAFPCDVADRAQVDALTKKVLDQYGKIDIVVNNAGVIWPVDNLVQSDPEAWAYNIQVNLLGPYYLVRNVLPIMVEQHYGRIVNVSSGAAINPIVGASAYSTAKAGMDMFTRAVAQELVESGVSITSFHPGMVDTEMQVDLRSVDTADATFDLSRFHSAYEEGRLRSPVAVSHAITWLAGPWSGEHSGKIFKITDEEWILQVDHDLGLA
jgi:NAD(P)-dependent dehydrogenase (short-subunit alcohol dehydrogenase family)